MGELKQAWTCCIGLQVSWGISPLAAMDEPQGTRGMEFWHDIRDHLGGWPFDFVPAWEVFSSAGASGLQSLHVQRMGNRGGGNTEYLFRKLPAWPLEGVTDGWPESWI